MEKNASKVRRMARLNRIKEKFAEATEKPFFDAGKISSSDESAIWKSYGISQKPKVKKPDINKA